MIFTGTCKRDVCRFPFLIVALCHSVLGQGGTGSHFPGDAWYLTFHRVCVIFIKSPRICKMVTKAEEFPRLVSVARAGHTGTGKTIRTAQKRGKNEED